MNHNQRNYWHMTNERIAERRLPRRRTFATLALEQGLRHELVMKIAGHKNWASFKRYVNITADVVSREFHRVYGGGGA